MIGFYCGVVFFDTLLGLCLKLGTLGFLSVLLGDLEVLLWFGGATGSWLKTFDFDFRMDWPIGIVSLFVLFMATKGYLS